MNPEQAIDALQRRELALLCGAGISVNPPSTLPEWKAFRDETVKAVAGDDGFLQPLVEKLIERKLISVMGSRGLAPEVVASAISSVTAGYFLALTALKGDAPNQNHTVIARAAKRGLLRHIVSTNWDGMIEAALDQADVAFRVFRTNEEFAACDLDAEPEIVHIYKIHGCLTKPESITARIEDEARGLPEAKAAVLQSLLNRFGLLLWGYSGQDLKIDLDYLQMVRCQPSAPGFLWNLHAEEAYREEPNQYVLELAKQYGERGTIAHAVLPDLLNSQLEPAEQVPAVKSSWDEITALRTKKNAELRNSLAGWAASQLDPLTRLEAMALMLQHAGELADAAKCYERVGVLAEEKEGGRAFRVARATARAIHLYAAVGEVAVAEQLGRGVDDTARTHGDLLLVAEAGLVLAEGMRTTAQFLPALRAYGYGQILLGGVDEPATDLQDAYELGIGDTFADVGCFDLALERYTGVEARARRDGRLTVVAAALARRSWVLELQDNFEAALTTLRAADEIARSLGLRREHAVWSLRILSLEDSLSVLSDERRTLPGDYFKTRNELGEKAVVYARDARDPLLFMQASLFAVVKKGVAIPLGYVAEADKQLDEIEAFARAGGNQRLLLEVASRRAWIRANLQQHEGALEAIRTALGLLASVGDDGLKCGLLDLMGGILMQTANDPRALLDCSERLAAIERKRGRMYPALETRLIQTRRELGLGDYPTDWQGLRRSLAESHPAMDNFVEVISRSEGFADWEMWGEALEQAYGPDWRYAYVLQKIGEKCKQLRMANQAELAIGPLSAVVKVARSWCDYQIAAMTMNEKGLALMTLSRPEEALACFEEAGRLADLGKDEAEQIDDWFNAAAAWEQLQRYDEAVKFCNRIMYHPRAKRDPALALETSLRYGELTKLAGQAEIALTHFEAAEPLARAMGRDDRLLQVTQRLGKVHFELGDFGPSIRYRLEAGKIMEAGQKPEGAANMFWLVANTYFTKLGRPRDAWPYYQHAVELFEQASAVEQLSRIRVDHDRCAELAKAAEGEAPGLYEFLTEHVNSPDERDRLLLRIAAGMGFNVWHFEPRSFAAYCDSPLVELPSTDERYPPVRFPLRGPVCLQTIAGAARYEAQKGNTTESARLAEVAATLARLWALPAELPAGMLGSQ